jgi:hypothetical protein
MVDKVAWTSGSFLIGRDRAEESSRLMSSLVISSLISGLFICPKCRNEINTTKYAMHQRRKEHR